ncbi:MAG: FAD-dependent oxidoreductase [Candidatus Omnitrophica bacterium]|nr:FAD-dependent oxidoreductase [Candidatus Omnitrophota bacterium]
MVIFETEVIDIIERAPGVKSFRFLPKEGVSFEPGQFFFVGIKVNGEERTKHFSFSNSPTEKGYVEFTKRITESDYSRALDRLKAGDWAKLKMSLGSFTLQEADKKIAFLSGGIGITPIRSMCRYTTDLGLPVDMVLLYGNNREEDIIFREDLDEMETANKNIRIAYTLTSPDIDKGSWQGRLGYIDDRMVREEILDYKDRIFYICGPPRMVESLTATLKDGLGLGDDQIRTENFAGY